MYICVFIHNQAIFQLLNKIKPHHHYHSTILEPSMRIDYFYQPLLLQKSFILFTVKPFRGANISQMKWHVKPTTEQNPKNIILHCGNMIYDDSEPQIIADEIIKLAKSITKDCNSNLAVSGIVTRFVKLNEKVRSFWDYFDRRWYDY